jgi:hypothetical protein
LLDVTTYSHLKYKNDCLLANTLILIPPPKV